MALASFSLDARVGLVTGGAGGLGGAIAEALAEAGANVAVADKVDSSAVVAAVESTGRKGLGLSMDVSDLDQVFAGIDATIQRFGQLDILVNCAAITFRKDSVDVTPDEWDAVMAVNLRGMFFACTAAAKHMIPRRRGKIINISSITGKMGMPGVVPYCTTKGGVIQMTAALAVEWGPYNLNVNAIGPGWHRSGFTTLRFSDPDWVKEMLEKVPLGRVGEPDDIKGLAVYLASDASNYLTGQTIFLDGGLTIDMSVKPDG